MFAINIFVSYFLLFLVLCESVSVDKLLFKKCSLKDFECQKDLYKNVMRSISKSGIPEFGIPPTDPFEVKDITVAVHDLIIIGMEKGLAKGIKKCVFNDLVTDMEKKVFKLDMTCDITIKGKYTVSANSSLIQSLLGSSTIDANGFAKIDLTKIHIHSEYDFFLRKDDSGDIYFDYKPEGMSYTYDVEKVQFYIENLFVNGQDYSKVAVALLNDNWKFVMDGFGKPFMDKVMELFYKFTHKFYEAVPAKDLIIEDMSPYL